MRIMVTGGRTYGMIDNDMPILERPKRMAERKRMREALDACFILPRSVSEVIHGGARGADRFAKEWAFANKVKATEFPAKWEDLEVPDAVIKTRRDGKQYNVLAGFMRNQAMVDSKPDLVVAFPGGAGTADAVRRAKEAGIEVLEIE